jgi:hypothetical protein
MYLGSKGRWLNVRKPSVGVCVMKKWRDAFFGQGIPSFLEVNVVCQSRDSQNGKLNSNMLERLKEQPGWG